MSAETNSTSGCSMPPDDSSNKLSEKNNQPNPLTCIRNAYTLAYTESGSELDNVMVEDFLKTLAQVALSVAARADNTRKNSAGGEVNR